jgi:hypothetical protein
MKFVGGNNYLDNVKNAKKKFQSIPTINIIVIAKSETEY